MTVTTTLMLTWLQQLVSNLVVSLEQMMSLFGAVSPQPEPITPVRSIDGLSVNA